MTDLGIHCEHEKVIHVDELTPNPKNPNTHSPEQIERLAQILEYQGWRHPIVVSKRSGFIVAGHGRLAAARRLGVTHVPVDYQDFPDDDAEYAFLVSDNSIASWAELDLSAINLAIPELGPDFDVAMLGLKDFTIDVAERDEDPDAVPEPPKVAKTKRGELWLLGEHRVLCGDATDRADVERLMAGERAVLMVTDPPYGVEYDANWRNEAAKSGAIRWGTSINLGKVKNDDRAEWADAYTAFGAQVAYVWHAPTFGPIIEASLVAAGFQTISQMVWVKPHFTISRGDYHWRHESCLYAVAKGKTHNWQGSRSESTVWEISHDTEKTGHGTQKPVECMERPIRNNTAQGELVVDPFLGSGTTVIAAQRTKRRCFGTELDPVYVDVILQRFANFAGIDPVRESDGMKWSQL